MTIYALYFDGHVAVMPMDGAQASRRLRLGAILEQVLPVRGVPVTRLLWHVERAANLRGVVRDPRAATPSEAARSDIALAAFYSAFAGLCLVLLFYNLALWGALRHRFLLHYCLMVAALLVYGFSSSGALAWAAPFMDNNDRLRVNNLALAAAAVAAFAFARSFFEPAVFAGRLSRAVTAASVAVLSSATLLALFEDRWPLLLDRLFALCMMSLVLLVGPILYRAWRVRSVYFAVFCVSWAAPAGFALLRIGSTFGAVPMSFWLDNSTILAMMTEALLSSLAIAYRVHLLSRERDRAREDETAARLLAATDPLTGLLNRRAFLAQAIGRTGRQTLLILDLDHFKQVNETIGHDGGDEVLRLVASFLQKATPAGALVARIGGEEFAMVVDAAVEIDPAQLLFDLRTRRMPFDIDVTASIGVSAGRLAREVDWNALYRAADQALFDAKASGRDRVRRALVAVN
jgi:diguanylate cyclase (GGDEF)-like protein